MNISDKLKKSLQNQQKAYGSWCQIGHQASAEILAGAGFEWIALDCEHGEAEDADISDFCRTLKQYDCTPMVRVKENKIMPIRRALDLGAMGVVVPLVNSADEARQAVAAAKYPPEGIRGFAFCRGNEWGVEFDKYVTRANEAVTVIVMIESKSAVDNIEEIVQVNGVDGVFIGPYDMSGSYGIVGQTEDEVIERACMKVADVCKKHGKSAGIHIVLPSPEKINAAINQGFTLLALGMDTVFLAKGAKETIGMIKND